LRRDVGDPSSKVGDAAIAQRVKGIREKRKWLEELEDEQFAEVSKNLSVRQQAKLIIFMRDNQHEMRHLTSQDDPFNQGLPLCQSLSG
jgi:hypothetical protein